ncbi:uncharacterized protein F5891DRAFT_989132 [Suillus fuscotomentosus]|uniref:Uncharacterized protein n=1 Tax=Suillus fuscotomentosus TaxID=1912939 RepID=A0AAD4DNF2_9AGAM|nr:uncharacterized protein F5891DRAFT_989132 [Suillus fuscotomentosus]KAG1886354.1 hypothetical protein F5891DRAFT_989132 [Suillus fuscotomentosus]
MGVDTDGDEGTFYDMWKSFGRWGVKVLDRVTVDVSTTQIFSQRQALLATLDSPPFELPLTANPSYDNSWLSPLSLTLFVVPTQNASDINQFVHDSWHLGAASRDHLWGLHGQRRLEANSKVSEIKYRDSVIHETSYSNTGSFANPWLAYPGQGRTPTIHFAADHVAVFRRGV